MHFCAYGYGLSGGGVQAGLVWFGLIWFVLCGYRRNVVAFFDKKLIVKHVIHVLFHG